VKVSKQPDPPGQPPPRRIPVDPLRDIVQLGSPVAVGTPPIPPLQLRPKRIRRRPSDPIGLCGCGRPSNHRGMCSWRWAENLERKTTGGR